MQAKITSALPKTEPANGLNSAARRLMNEPENIVYAVVALDCGKISTEYKFDIYGERYTEFTPHARIRGIEPLTGDRLRTARALMADARNERIGGEQLPLDFTVGDVTG